MTVQAGGGGLVAHALDSTTWHNGDAGREPGAVGGDGYGVCGAYGERERTTHNYTISQTPRITAGNCRAWLGKTGSDLAHLETRAHDAPQGVTADQHHNKLHNVTDDAPHN